MLATQTLLQKPAKNMLVRVDGALPPGCTAKDIVLAIIGRIGTAGGTGHVIEYAGEAIRALDMAGRMTVCNMTIEAGARAGMIAPDDTTFDYMRGPPVRAEGRGVRPGRRVLAHAAVRCRRRNTTRTVTLDAADIAPMVTWGTNPEAVLPITGVGARPGRRAGRGQARADAAHARVHGLTPGQKTDRRARSTWCSSAPAPTAASRTSAPPPAWRAGRQVAPGVRALVVPGSGLVKQQAEAEGLDRILLEAGFEWREPGCSMCLGMNPDKLTPGPALRQHVEPQFRGPAGAGRAHASGVAGHGRRRRGDRAAWPTCGSWCDGQPSPP